MLQPSRIEMVKILQRGAEPKEASVRILSVVVSCMVLLCPPLSLAKSASLKGQLYRQGHTVSGADVYLSSKEGVRYRGPVTTEESGYFVFEGVDDGTYCLTASLNGNAIGSAVVKTSAFTSGYLRVDLTSQQGCASDPVQQVTAPLTTPSAIKQNPNSPSATPKEARYKWPSKDTSLINIFCALCAIVVIYPLVRYLTRHWAFRRDRLFGLLERGAIVYYYKQFRPGDDPKMGSEASPNADDYMKAFEKDFTRWYGRKYYMAPLLMLIVLTCAATWWGALSLHDWVSGHYTQDSLRTLVASALAGAFVWIISDELDRLRRRDFTVTDVYYYVFRLLLSVPFGWALTRATVTLQVGIPLAFFLGAFPTTTLFTIARRIGSQQLKLGDDAQTGALELESLQSIGKANAERFKDEGVTTICGLAYADPIDLTIRTNFDFNYVVDCVSQALMWIYFGKDSASLFALSLRGAQEVSALVAWLDDPRHQETASQTVADAASRLKISEGALRTTLNQIAEDPYTRFLVNVWA